MKEGMKMKNLENISEEMMEDELEESLFRRKWESFRNTGKGKFVCALVGSLVTATTFMLSLRLVFLHPFWALLMTVVSVCGITYTIKQLASIYLQNKETRKQKRKVKKQQRKIKRKKAVKSLAKSLKNSMQNKGRKIANRFTNGLEKIKNSRKNNTIENFYDLDYDEVEDIPSPLEDDEVEIVEEPAYAEENQPQKEVVYKEQLKPNLLDSSSKTAEQILKETSIANFQLYQGPSNIKSVDLSALYIEPGLTIVPEHFIVHPKDIEMQRIVEKRIEEITGCKPMFTNRIMDGEEKKVYMLIR